MICDAAAGTCGFLVAAGEYLRGHSPAFIRDDRLRKHFHTGLFHGFDFDASMLRIGAVNTTLHEVEDADVTCRDSVAEEQAGDEGRNSLILPNPPLAGSLDCETTAKDLLKIIKS